MCSITSSLRARAYRVTGLCEAVPTWLKAGFVEYKQLFPTTQDTPQSGIISPTLANMTLDGLEAAIDKAFGIAIRPDGCRKNNKYKIHLIRYADDFVVTASEKEILENKAKPLIEEFLSKRGLLLSPEKTKITYNTKGFDFVGQNIRMFSRRKLLIRPAKEAIRSMIDKMKGIIVKHRGSQAAVLIRNLNPVITGWFIPPFESLSRMMGNYQVQFLGDNGGVIRLRTRQWIRTNRS
ncbi:MAG: reverse transcriptase domain-containing protein [Bacteroidales bacterium]|nr:reverse transcriptase domain-containing protein [Bacteroidales bacterium]